jgi:hypothetical protein
MSSAFSAKLTRPTGTGTWTFALVPKATAAAAGFRARLRVKGTIDGVAFRSALIPRGGGEVFVIVNTETRARIGKTSGDTVRLELQLDARPISVRVPPALQRALRDVPKASAFFQTLTASQRLAYTRWIADAKQSATRDRRVKVALDKLARREKFN